MELSGNMTRQVEQDMPISEDDSHIVNVGRLVEDMELKMRNLLRECFPLVKGLFCSLEYHSSSWIMDELGGLANVDQRRSTLGRQRMLLETSEVLLPQLLSQTLIDRDSDFFLGIAPLTESNREKATHQEMINSMKR